MSAAVRRRRAARSRSRRRRLVRAAAYRPASRRLSRRQSRPSPCNLVLSDDFVDLVKEGDRRRDPDRRTDRFQPGGAAARAETTAFSAPAPAYLAAHGDAAERSPTSRGTICWPRPARIRGGSRARGGPATVHVDGRLKTNSNEVVREAVDRRARHRAALDLGCRAGTARRPPRARAAGLSARHGASRSMPSIRAGASWPPRCGSSSTILAALYGEHPKWDEGLGSDHRGMRHGRG